MILLTKALKFMVVEHLHLFGNARLRSRFTSPEIKAANSSNIGGQDRYQALSRSDLTRK